MTNTPPTMPHVPTLRAIAEVLQQDGWHETADKLEDRAAEIERGGQKVEKCHVCGWTGGHADGCLPNPTPAAEREKVGEYRVSYERKVGNLLYGEMWPIRESRPLTCTETDAWHHARDLAAGRVGEFVNVYVINAGDFTPVPGYETKKISNRIDPSAPLERGGDGASIGNAKSEDAREGANISPAPSSPLGEGLEVSGDTMTLAECPIGLFLAGEELCLKTEYGNNEGRIDAYIVSSGEFFWGNEPQTIARQRAQIVRPVIVNRRSPRPSTAGERVRVINDTPHKLTVTPAGTDAVRVSLAPHPASPTEQHPLSGEVREAVERWEVLLHDNEHKAHVKVWDAGHALVTLIERQQQEVGRLNAQLVSQAEYIDGYRDSATKMGLEVERLRQEAETRAEAAEAQLAQVRERLEKAQSLFADMLSAHDSKHLGFHSPEIVGQGDPEIGYQTHAWHDEWLHYVRKFMEAANV